MGRTPVSFAGGRKPGVFRALMVIVEADVDSTLDALIELAVANSTGRAEDEGWYRDVEDGLAEMRSNVAGD